jgi:RimJ/RimL family protein N-acetyltransferase
MQSDVICNNDMNLIETERLILRGFKESDVDDVFEFSSNPEVLSYTGEKPLTQKSQAMDIIRNIWFSDYAKYGFGRWAVIHKQDNKLFGFAGLKYLADIDEVDIGYRFLPQYWGQGLATEAAIPFMKYGFEDLKLKKIIGIAMEENIASCKILEKIGLEYYQTVLYPNTKNLFKWFKKENS